MKKVIILAAIIFQFLFTFSQELEELSFYPLNGNFGVASQDDQLYLSNGGILDISDAFNPILMSQVIFSGVASTILIEGDYAYFGTGMSNTIHIADISNLSFPLVLSSHPFIQGNGVFGMDLTDDILFLTLGTEGLICSMDVSDKNSPFVIQAMTVPGGQCRDIIIKDQYAYAAHQAGLKVVDISDPSNMQIVNSIGNAYNSIDRDENILCLGKNDGGVDVFDISSPTSPNLLVSIPNSAGTAWSVKIKNNHIYLATDLNGLYVYRINESSYTEIDQYKKEGNGQSFDLCLNDSLIILPGLVEGVSILAFDTINLVKTNEASSQNTISISPNPFNQRIYINHTEDFVESIMIYNLKGELVSELHLVDTKVPIDLSYLSAGVFTISIRTMDHILVEKIIKI